VRDADIKNLFSAVILNAKNVDVRNTERLLGWRTCMNKWILREETIFVATVLILSMIYLVVNSEMFRFIILYLPLVIYTAGNLAIEINGN
jgi:hypothetical protein